MNMNQQNSDYLQLFFEKKIFDLRLLNESYAFESSSSSFLSQCLYQDHHFSSLPFSSLLGSPLIFQSSGLERGSMVSSPFDFHWNNNMPDPEEDFHTQNQILFSQTSYEFPSETRINNPLNDYNNQVAKPEGVSVMKAVAEFKPERKPDGNNKRRKIQVKMEGDKEEVVIKGQWTSEEDRLLIRLVEENGKKNWSKIATMLRGRVGKQCRERWQNHLQPHIKKDKWSEEEDRKLIAAHKKLGNKWSEMAKLVPGRSENTIKNHWNATKRKQLAALRRGDNDNSNKCITVLQRYINSLMISTPALPAAASFNYPPVIQPPPNNNTAAVAPQRNENTSVYEYCYLEKEELFPVPVPVPVPVCGGDQEDSFFAMICSGGSGYEFGSCSSSINGIMRSGTVTPSTATTEEELVVDAKTEMDFLTGDYSL